MLPSDFLYDQLQMAVNACAAQPLPELLLQQGWLRQQAQSKLLGALRESVQFDEDEEARVLEQLWHGLDMARPEQLNLKGDWIAEQPENVQAQLQQRWDWLRLQKAIEERYGDQVERHFLDRRADLERLVYGVIRVRHHGLADELYLRIIDDNADFGQLARRHSQGDERFTYGLVGPMPVQRLNPVLRKVLQSLSIGQIHPPFVLQEWVLLVKLDHREPLKLDDPTRKMLLEELLQQELEATLDQELTNLYPKLLQSHD